MPSKRSIFANTEVSLVLLIALLFLGFALVGHNFFTYYNVSNLFKQASITGIIAIAATFVIISGGIDLSVGSITGMSALVAAMLMSRTQMPVWISVLISVAVGLIIGLYNGIIIKEFRVAPFIATLGTMTIVRGIIEVVSEAKTIIGVNKEFAEFSNHSFLGIPNLVYVWIAVIIVSFLILRYTTFGRNIYVIGCGEEVAKLSGINMRLNTYAIYAFSGLLCGIAGVLLTSRLNSAVPTGGQGYEMSAIAAAVIGGASLSGGQGTVVGTVLGTFLMVLITNGGIHIGINPFIIEIVTGVLITVAVIIDQLRRRKEG